MLEHSGMIPYKVARGLYQIRKAGNKAAHNSYRSVSEAQILLFEADMIFNWFRSHF